MKVCENCKFWKEYNTGGFHWENRCSKGNKKATEDYNCNKWKYNA